MIEASEFPRVIPYRRFFPWLRLFRGIGMAMDSRKWVLAALGLALLSAGWGVLDRIIPGPPSRPIPLPPETLRDVSTFREAFAHAAEHVAAPVLRPAEIVIGLVRPGEAGRRVPHALLALLWAFFVWGIFGGAIARLAVIEIAAGRRAGPITALRFSGRKLTSLIAAPLVPLTSICFFLLLLAGFGLLYRVPGGFGAAVAGVIGFIPLLIGLIMLWDLIWLVAGWPLMVAGVAAQAEDTFDTLSRSHSYVYHRPWYFVFYTALAWIIGVIGFVFVAFAARWVLNLAAAGLAFGAPQEAVTSYLSPSAETAGSFAAHVHHGWVVFVGILVQSWAYSYFWSAAAQIYLLMRRAVDGTPIDEIALPDQESGDSFAPGAA